MRLSKILFLLVSRLAFADTYPRQLGVDAVHYTFRLTLSDATDEIVGNATVDLRFTASGVKEFTLDLGKPMTMTGLQPELPYRHDGDKLIIQLPVAPRVGERRLFQIAYHGKPASGLRIMKNKYGDRTFFSENWPDNARQWLPMIDHPYDKATSEFQITAPSNYQVVANGLLEEETDLGDGRRFTHWKQGVPIVSWLNALGVAQFSVRNTGQVKGIPISTWVYYQDRDKAAITFDEPTRQAMSFFSERVGPFQYEKLANVIAAGLNGGTEHASAIFYGERTIGDKPATRLVYHEIAHQWFGDAVTEKDWDDVWLSEGFATYFTLLAVEHYEGRDAFQAGLKRSREAIFGLDKTLPSAAVIHNNLADMKKVLNRLIYEKGGWTLHMLRVLIGDDKFMAGIRDYYQRYLNQNTTTAEFRHVMEEHAGIDLEWFFDQWLQRAGLPSVEGTWSYNADRKQVEIELKQTQAGEPYKLPLEVAVGDKVIKLRMQGQTERVSVSSEKAPDSVVLDPNSTTLMKASFKAK